LHQETLPLLMIPTAAATSLSEEQHPLVVGASSAACPDLLFEDDSHDRC